MTRKYVFLQTQASSIYDEYYNLAILKCDVDHNPTYIEESSEGNVLVLNVKYYVRVGPDDSSEGYRLARRMEAEVAELNAQYTRGEEA